MEAITKHVLDTRLFAVVEAEGSSEAAWAYWAYVNAWCAAKHRARLTHSLGVIWDAAWEWCGRKVRGRRVAS